MPKYAEISPNEPDVMPDYVDMPAAPSVNAEAPAPPPPFPEMQGEPPPYVDLESAHLLNAEIAPPEEAAVAEEPDVAAAEEPVDQPPFPELAEEAAAAPAPGHREGECIPNVPDITPELVSEEETVKPTPAAAPAEAEREAGKGLLVPSWLRWGYVAATLLLVSLFGVFVFSQAISSLSMAATLPTWAQYLLLIPLGLCALTVLGVCVSLVFSWLRLRAVKQVNISALEELRRRAETRKDGIEHFQAARGQLENYLRSYPLEGEGAKRLLKAGCPAAALDKLAKEREYLIGRTADSRSWLEDFREHFQNGVDKAAAGRVNSWSLKAAGCVMASPLPLLDAVLILGISIKMIKDLSVLYNVRSGGTASLVLLNRAIVYAFIAGVAEGATDTAGGFLGDEMAGVLGDTTFGTIGAGFARAVAPKLGEGAINALFIRRLGKATIRLLQPLRPN